jgi:hypothetical protein
MSSYENISSGEQTQNPNLSTREYAVWRVTNFGRGGASAVGKATPPSSGQTTLWLGQQTQHADDDAHRGGGAAERDEEAAA